MIILLCLVLVSAIHIVATHALLTRKKTIKYCMIAFVLNTLFFLITVIFVQKGITNILISKYIMYFLAFTYIAYIYIVFEESLSKKIFAMFSIWMFSTVILFFVISIVDRYIGKTDENTIRNVVYIIRICVEGLLLPLVYFVLSKSYKKVMAIIPNKIINLMSLYPVTAFLVLIKNNEVSFGRYMNFNTEYDVVLVSVLISLGYILIFAGIYSSAKVISLQYNYKIIENQVELQRQNYKKLSDSMDQLYTLKHDIRHHFSAIKTMLMEKNDKQALEYIEQFNQSELSKTIPTICENFVADSIIKYYMSLAMSKNIEFNTNINIPENTGINSLDLCVVLGNSLDNSIDACEKLDTSQKRTIEFTSKIAGTHMIFHITNSFDGKIKKINNIIQSSKQGPYHGLGLSSIQETVNKYNGDVSYKYTEDQFEITIIMCTNMHSHA